jgi:hypothetical protein
MVKIRLSRPSAWAYPDIWRVLFRTIHIVHDLVRSEEGQRIRVPLEVLDNPEDARQVSYMVRATRVVAVNALSTERRVDIEDHVDTNGIKDASAVIMVERGIDVVDADCVDLVAGSVLCWEQLFGYALRNIVTYTEALEQCSVAQTHGTVAERVLALGGLVACLSARLAGVRSAIRSDAIGACGCHTSQHQ